MTSAWPSARSRALPVMWPSSRIAVRSATRAVTPAPGRPDWTSRVSSARRFTDREELPMMKAYLSSFLPDEKASYLTPSPGAPTVISALGISRTALAPITMIVPFKAIILKAPSALSSSTVEPADSPFEEERGRCGVAFFTPQSAEDTHALEYAT
ncbi:hypothetical protein BDZ90DRAFT_24747 [Jaminaea rosea]|uniref:Uncharacterized protein n=1 Tax=Jaminaea rosea TaxID=1569628 RepID=A0A316V2J7_9BASI|nr:hypothetical protein BDZ90DRAFT_24747 [Jaminaea rosea]PWN30791.1 hypothetical protein BDZ90DRAFT_24747 [Jaminaea rosea]